LFSTWTPHGRRKRSPTWSKRGFNTPATHGLGSGPRPTAAMGRSGRFQHAGDHGRRKALDIASKTSPLFQHADDPRSPEATRLQPEITADLFNTPTTRSPEGLWRSRPPRPSSFNA
jgi:hypothetical protein